MINDHPFDHIQTVRSSYDLISITLMNRNQMMIDWPIETAVGERERWLRRSSHSASPWASTLHPLPPGHHHYHREDDNDDDDDDDDDDVKPEWGGSSVDPWPPLEGGALDLPRTRDWEERRLNPVKELLVAHRAVDPRGDDGLLLLLLGVGFRPQQVHLVLQLRWAAVLQDVAHLVSNEVDNQTIRVVSHRVEVDLAHVVQLVPLRVGLVHHRAFQMNLKGWQEILNTMLKVRGRAFIGRGILPLGFLCNCRSGRRIRCQRTSGWAARWSLSSEEPRSMQSSVNNLIIKWFSDHFWQGVIFITMIRGGLGWWGWTWAGRRIILLTMWGENSFAKLFPDPFLS